MADTSFFLLPIELRQMIYHLALLPGPSDLYTDPSLIIVDFMKMPNRSQLKANCWSNLSFQQRLNLLYVNKQIHDEAEYVLYTFFRIHFANQDLWRYVHPLQRWLAVKARRWIRKIVLFASLPMRLNPRGSYQEGVFGPQCFQLLGENLSNLKRVHLTINFRGPAVRPDDSEYLVPCVLEKTIPTRHGAAFRQ